MQNRKNWPAQQDKKNLDNINEIVIEDLIDTKSRISNLRANLF
jgi:hypothetical protein